MWTWRRCWPHESGAGDKELWEDNLQTGVWLACVHPVGGTWGGVEDSGGQYAVVNVWSVACARGLALPTNHAFLLNKLGLSYATFEKSMCYREPKLPWYGRNVSSKYNARRNLRKNTGISSMSDVTLSCFIGTVPVLVANLVSRKSWGFEFCFAINHPPTRRAVSLAQCAPWGTKRRAFHGCTSLRSPQTGASAHGSNPIRGKTLKERTLVFSGTGMVREWWRSSRSRYTMTPSRNSVSWTVCQVTMKRLPLKPTSMSCFGTSRVNVAVIFSKIGILSIVKWQRHLLTLDPSADSLNSTTL